MKNFIERFKNLFEALAYVRLYVFVLWGVYKTFFTSFVKLLNFKRGLSKVDSEISRES